MKKKMNYYPNPCPVDELSKSKPRIFCNKCAEDCITVKPLVINDILYTVRQRHKQQSQTFCLNKSRIMLNSANFLFTSVLIFILCIVLSMID